ncbi:MAG TPA: hypothetical protein VH540_27235 [Ktedonobacterales bacterium]|jgi:virginiamycin B lyase
MDPQTGDTKDQPGDDVWEQSSLEEDQGQERVSGPLSLGLLERQMGQPSQLVPVQTLPVQPRHQARRRGKIGRLPIFVGILLGAVLLLPLLTAPRISCKCVTAPTPIPTYAQQGLPTLPASTDIFMTPETTSTFAEYALLQGGSPFGIVVGPDGAIWFTLANSNQIGRLTPDGHLRLFGGVAYGPEHIAVGPDGNLWITQYNSSQVIRFSPDGNHQNFQGSGGPISNLTAGPDGGLWFTEPESNKIGRFSMDGQVREFPVPTSDSRPLGITSGPDGNLWFTEYKSAQVGRITPDGQITEFRLPAGSTGPYGIITGHDKQLWVIEPVSGVMVRMTTRGTTRQFQLPFTNNSSSSLAVGTDGNIWFTDYDQIGSITPAGSVNMFTIPTLDGQISGLAAGPAGTLWFTEFFSCKIGEFKING